MFRKSIVAVNPTRAFSLGSQAFDNGLLGFATDNSVNSMAFEFSDEESHKVDGRFL